MGDSYKMTGLFWRRLKYKTKSSNYILHPLAGSPVLGSWLSLFRILSQCAPPHSQRMEKRSFIYNVYHKYTIQYTFCICPVSTECCYNMITSDCCCKSNYQTRNYYAYIAHLRVYKDDKIDKSMIGWDSVGMFLVCC